MRFLTCLLILLTSCVAESADRPNLVWISVEDISAHLGCYGDSNATTPNLDAFAEQGVRYTRAFTCHGVCAPCRTGIITGMFPMSLGANHMRSKVDLPEAVRLFPSYLKKAGYYCTNNSKEDYNLNWPRKQVWDESSGKAHWKNRKGDQPFFAVFNLTSTHESKIWPQGWQKITKNLAKDKFHDPSKMVVPPLYPDTAEVRAAFARLQDIITVTDQRIGKYLQELEDAGLADDTIVIFWSDHGDGFPRAKRWVYDSGTLVPMIARVPEKFRMAGQAEPGSVSDQMINLIDLGPTMLNLAGLSVPENMVGRPFLGDNLPAARKYVHGARDRIDERLDMVRSVRGPKFRYVRNLNPWREALQHIEYSERSIVRKEMRRMLADGSLAPELAQFLTSPRPYEELYDTANDPWELKNLASDPKFSKDLERLRAECDRWQQDNRDAHLIPEVILAEEESKFGSRWAALNSQPESGQRFEDLLRVAKVAASPMPDYSQLASGISSDDAAIRWWAASGLAQLADSNPKAKALLEDALKDSSSAVRIAAATALSNADVLRQELEKGNKFEQHAALVGLSDIGKDAAIAKQSIQAYQKEKGYTGNLARQILKSLE